VKYKFRVNCFYSGNQGPGEIPKALYDLGKTKGEVKRQEMGGNFFHKFFISKLEGGY